MKYVQVHDGEWVDPINSKEHYIRCCDCGLVHRVSFRVRAGRIEYRPYRDKRRTAAARRKKQVKS